MAKKGRRECEEPGFGVYGPFGIPIFETPKARACRKALRNEDREDRREERTERKETRQEERTGRTQLRQEANVLQTGLRNIYGDPDQTAQAAIGAVPGVVQGAATLLTGGATEFAAGLAGLFGVSDAGAPQPSGPDTTTLLLLGLGLAGVAAYAAGGK